MRRKSWKLWQSLRRIGALASRLSRGAIPRARGTDDEVTYRRNTAAFEACDLVPNVLRGVTDVDMSVTRRRRCS
jgi:hypothetical protein